MESALASRPDASQNGAPAEDDVALQLPLDFARTPAGGRLAASHAFTLTLPALADTAPETLLSAALAIALARYSSQDSIPLLCSRLLANGQLLGSSALRLRTTGPTTLRDLLAQVVEQAATLAPPRWVRSGDRAAISFVDTDLGEAPDVQRLLALAPAELRSADLHLVVSGRGDRRHAALVYNAKLIKATSAARWAAHLEVLLGSILSTLDAPIGEIPLLSTQEREWLALVGSGGHRPLPSNFIHESFEAHCRTRPDAVAVRYRDEPLSYAQLNARANRLAHWLMAQGIVAEDAVVVCVEPGFDIAIALLAILKAGAVYVPIDPSYPTARLRAILDDTAPKLVLSRSHLLPKLALDGIAHFAFDTDERRLDAAATENPARRVDPAQTASIYYTSGTTGKPKGVMASQANLRAYIGLAQERYGVGAHDVLPAIARFSFSISMFELMSPLAAGGTLVVLEREHVLDPERLARTLRDVTFFHAGPSLLKNLFAHLRRQGSDWREFARVRHASSGGDMIAPEILESLKEVFAQAEVFVIYGCSEVSCMGCTWGVPRDRLVTRTLVGKPFDNTTVRVLDARGRPLPAGVAGEICFAGAGVVKGYLRRPELSAEKFVQIDGERFYRTGDMGRLHDDGSVEILGRNDFQINVRGMRIEIGEVEAHLRRAPGVRDAVVSARIAPSGDKTLVAYFVADFERAEPQPAQRIAAIRRHLVDHLPDYMVPAAYVELDKLPLNHNLKVDRRALPEPGLGPQRSHDAFPVRDPQTPSERELARLWQRVLGVDRVGLDDNFFELGGHSLSATEFIAAVKQEMRAELQGMEVLRESLEVLAALCDRRLGRPAPDPAQRERATSAAERIEIFHFGPQRSLYGALHLPVARRSATGAAVLVCAPVGHEHVRSHFILNRLGRQLAAQGVPVLRFDYFGCGDSGGESEEAGCERWQHDIADACAELRRRSEAQFIVGVGVRLGATLLSKTVPQLDLARLVLWDPVGEGMAFYAEMAEMQRRYVLGTQHLRLGRAPRATLAAVELLGATYSPDAVRQLQALAIAALPAALPVKWLITSQPQQQRELYQLLAGNAPHNRVEQLDIDCGWSSIARMSEVLPDVGISRALAAFVREGT